ncbi:MAG: hypothetical protein U5K31_02470 [Balneolaceae bacterium]|nr:hypothetical protein [Balneolaceae bacterium]
MTRPRNVCQRYFVPDPGVIREIRVPDWVRQDPGVALLVFWMKEGDRIESPTHHVARPGLVIVTGDSRQEARERAGRVIEAVDSVLSKNTQRRDQICRRSFLQPQR